MDALELGTRLAQAREQAGITQEGLGRAVGLDRTAITRLEKGERKLSVPELVAIAQVLGRPLAYFVSEPVPAAVSRRRDAVVTGHDTTLTLDAEIHQFASDVQTLLAMGLLGPSSRPASARTPASHQAAEQMAGSIRRQQRLGTGPIDDLGSVCERLGLYVFSAALGDGGPDGGCVEVVTDSGSAGAAVINGDAPAGRRRMTLAHELAHWLAGDAYDAGVSDDAEKMISSFAIHFLAPRAGVHAVWRSSGGSARDRALGVAASFRLSWSAAVGQLRNLDLIAHDEYGALVAAEPRRGDYMRLGLTWIGELSAPSVSPRFSAAVVDGFATGRLTAERAAELLRGTLAKDDLPDPATSLEDLRRSFTGHDE